VAQVENAGPRSRGEAVADPGTSDPAGAENGEAAGEGVEQFPEDLADPCDTKYRRGR